jgi:hypothetical protein
MFPILAFSAISSGLTPIRMFRVGEKMTVVFPSLSVKKSFQLSIKSTILT